SNVTNSVPQHRHTIAVKLRDENVRRALVRGRWFDELVGPVDLQCERLRRSSLKRDEADVTTPVSLVDRLTKRLLDCGALIVQQLLRASHEGVSWITWTIPGFHHELRQCR